MRLNEFFPHIVCINLDKRPDRWKRVQARFAQHHISPVRRFPAFDGATLETPLNWDDSPGAYGCLRSHLAVVEEAREQGRPNVLIFEDDVVFAPEFELRFSQHVGQLPADWDMLMFGCLHGAQPLEVSTNLVKITNSLSTFAYALNHTMYDGFVELNRESLSAVDHNSRVLQKRFNCYCFMPHLAWVEEDYSDIREATLSYWWVKESLVLNSVEMERTLKRTAVIISYRNSNQHAARNLSFLVSYFSRTLPDVAVCVIEQGDQPSLDIQALPPLCSYEFLETPEGFKRGRAFNAGFRRFASCKEYFIFMDSDIFLTRDDLRANLLMCREHDFIRAFTEVSDLSEEGTRMIFDNPLHQDDNADYHLRNEGNLCGSCCIFTSQGMRVVGEWDELDDNEGEQARSLKVKSLLKVFKSPSRARRLFGGRDYVPVDD